MKFWHGIMWGVALLVIVCIVMGAIGTSLKTDLQEAVTEIGSQVQECLQRAPIKAESWASRSYTRYGNYYIEAEEWILIDGYIYATDIQVQVYNDENRVAQVMWAKSGRFELLDDFTFGDISVTNFLTEPVVMEPAKETEE